MATKSEKELRDEFQKRLFELINAAGSLETFCEKVGAPYYTVNQYLGDGTNSEPTRTILSDIIEACDVDANWLLTGKGGLTGLSDEALQIHVQAVDNFYKEYAEESSPELRRSRLRALLNECKTLLDATANIGEVAMPENAVSFAKADSNEAHLEEQREQLKADQELVEQEKAQLEKLQHALNDKVQELETSQQSVHEAEEMVIAKLHELEVKEAEIDQMRENLQFEQLEKN